MLKRSLYILLFLATVAAIVLMVFNRGRYYSLLFDGTTRCPVEVEAHPATTSEVEVGTAEPTAAEATESADSLVSDPTIAPIVK